MDSKVGSDNNLIEILTIGDELLRGDLVDTNSAWLAGRCHQLGLIVARATSVGDALDDIVAALRGSAAPMMVVSGGLGPTDDDRTAAAVARAAGVPLALDDEALEMVRARFTATGLAFTANNEKQAWFPQGAEVLVNRRGTAPGFVAQVAGCRVFCLPGVPRELRPMFDESVAPQLQPAGGAMVLRQYKLFGLAEAQVDDKLAGLLAAVDQQGCDVSLHFRATFPEIHVIVVVRASEASEAVAEQVARAVDDEVQRRVGRYLFATGEQSFSEAVVEALRARGATLALAESCTGGLAGDLITNAPGSSEVFLLGTVTYSNDAKIKLLNVSSELIDQHGAVSQQCVEAMALGVRELAGSTYSAAISGIAGPGGGTPDKPVGTVHVAIAGPEGILRHTHRVFGFDRVRVKKIAAYVAHALVLQQVKASPSHDPLGGRWRPTAATRPGGTE
jgi:nicotinamide-nucleotide amidase